MPAALDWLKLVFLGFLLAELLTGCGIGQLRLFSRRRMGLLSRCGAGYLLGLGLIGPLLLGLACAGLFYPSLVVLTAVLACLGSRASWKRLYVVDCAREAGFSPPALALLLLAIAGLPRLLVPETNLDVNLFRFDSYLYHLAAVGQYLDSHTILVSHINKSFHLPLPVDILFSIPLALGDDRLASMLSLFCFLAVSAWLAENRRKAGGGPAAWLGILLALSSAYLFALAIETKNDLPASALLLAGVFALQSGALVLGSLLLGASIAAKPVYIFFVAVFLAAYAPRLIFRIRTLTFLFLPSLPWLAKSYLATGVPTSPFLASLFSSFEWGAQHESALAAYLDQWGGGGLAGTVAFIAGELWADHPILLLLLPGLLFLRGTRSLTLTFLVAGGLVLAFSRVPRYWLPGVWFLSFLAVEGIGDIPRQFRNGAVFLVAGACLIRIFLLLDIPSLSWRAMLISREIHLQKRLSTYGEAIEEIRKIGARRVITIGEGLVYRLPARVIYGGYLRETPLIWKLAKEADGIARLHIKFRQLGASHLLYNYVSAEWTGMRYASFGWDSRSLRNYIDYLKLYMEPVWRTETSNFDYGGYVLYRVRNTPLSPKPERIWFAPGTEQLYAKCALYRSRQDNQALLQHCQGVFRLIPDVGTAWNELGHVYNRLNDYEKAYEYLKEFTDAGMLDQKNISDYGIAALRIGRADQAERLLKEALIRTPAQVGAAGKDLARIMLIRAGEALKRGDLEEATERIGEAEGYLKLLGTGPPWPPDALPAEVIREFWAVAALLRGRISLARGHESEAAAWFDKAWEIYPENPMVIKTREAMRGNPGGR